MEKGKEEVVGVGPPEMLRISSFLKGIDSDTGVVFGVELVGAKKIYACTSKESGVEGKVGEWTPFIGRER
jgi:hypothetical protein